MTRELRLFCARIWKLDPADAAEALALSEWFRFFWPMVRWHQAIEEEVLHPRLEASARASTAALVAEHAELQDLASGVQEALDGFVSSTDRMDRLVWRSSLTVRATRLEALLVSHFGREDEALLPLVREHLDPRELDEMVDVARRRTSRAQWSELVPWLAAHTPPEARRRLLRRLPLLLQILYRWRWQKRYERAASSLLGQAQAA